VTSPPTRIVVECPRCATRYEDWYRASVNLDLDDFDEAYRRAASTSACPACGHVVEFEMLVVEDGVWRIG
jgi:endogenous inhibitor of DNA gyrase (YacG/DUF329 family)